MTKVSLPRLSSHCFPSSLVGMPWAEMTLITNPLMSLIFLLVYFAEIQAAPCITDFQSKITQHLILFQFPDAGFPN